MSGTLHSLRRKIDGADDLNGVVRAMKALGLVRATASGTELPKDIALKALNF